MRGLAVLGILAVNAPFFAAPWQTALNPTLPPLAIDAHTAWSWFVPHVFFEGKFITLFSMLFGASLYLVGGDRSDPVRERIVIRRVAWLALFGAIHGAFIWYGDVLLLYAASGAILMLLRGWTARALLTLGVGIYLTTSFWEAYRGLQLEHAPPASAQAVRAFLWEPAPREIAYWAEMFGGGFLQSLLANMQMWAGFAFATLKSGIPHTIGVMMIGMGLFKIGFLSGGAPRWVYWLSVGIAALALIGVSEQALQSSAAGFDFIVVNARTGLLNHAVVILISLGYASALVLCVQANILPFVTNALAPVGRMAFTNYVAQSLIMTAIFYGGRGPGLWGALDRPTLMLVVPVVWAAQLIWSTLWLRSFEMGPLEWVWRRLSYARPVAFAKTAVA